MKTNYGYTGNQKNTGSLLHYFTENGKSAFVNDQKEKNYENSSKSDTSYQCPMKCEGEKTYTKSGKCPLCHMQMMPSGCGYLFY